MKVGLCNAARKGKKAFHLDIIGTSFYHQSLFTLPRTAYFASARHFLPHIRCKNKFAGNVMAGRPPGCVACFGVNLLRTA